MGTPDFAVATLDALLNAGHEICAVITQPDRPSGRGYKLTPSAVKVRALERGLSVHQPETLKDNAILPLLEQTRPDVIVVAAYGKILPQYVLDFPPQGCINVHASILPKYRGAAPINWAIINGETESGVTIMYMEKGLDTGDMLCTVRTPILDDDTAGDLHDRLAELGADALVHTLALLKEHRITPVKQDDSRHTYAPMLSKSDCRLNFRQPASAVRNRIRGLAPFPGAVATLDGRPIKVCEARLVPFCGEPGRVLFADKEHGLVVACGDNALQITRLQPQGKRRMTAAEYLAGHPVSPGARAE